MYLRIMSNAVKNKHERKISTFVILRMTRLKKCISYSVDNVFIHVYDTRRIS